MSGNQITKKLEAAKFDMSKVSNASRDEVEIADERCARKAEKITGLKMAYRTGYGSWFLQAKPTDMGDFNDRSSRWHY